jgi:hypothetical protein
MKNQINTPGKAPCKSCPYRRDVPSGVWAAEEYAKLPAFDNETLFQPAGVFMCHQQDGRMCAGWTGCHDMEENLAIRLATSMGDLTVETYNEVLDYQTTVPLWETGAAAAEHGMARLEDPDVKAQQLTEKLMRKGLAC